MATTTRQKKLDRVTWIAALLALGLVACNNDKGGGAPAPTLQSVALSPSPAFVAVGTPQQFTATGTYSDGTKSALTSGLTWASSNALVASVDANGVVTPVANGVASITATHAASGLGGKTDVTSRVLTAVAATGLPASGAVDTTKSYVRVTGLTPGAMYAPTLDKLTDDVDLLVYGDVAMATAAQQCASQQGGTTPESCVAQANAQGELWLEVDGQWSEAGANYQVSVPAASPVKLDGTLAFATGLPHAASIGTGDSFFKVTGLAAGKSYEVRISNLSADIDVEVYGDVYQFGTLCASFNSGTVDDSCTAAANASGELYVEIDGESTTNGGSYTLSLTAK